MTCSRLGTGRAVLIGDAAHAMSANLGMGCNTALLDGAALAAAAVAVRGDLGALQARYTADHHPDVAAMNRLSRGLYDVLFLGDHNKWLRAFAGAPATLWVASGFTAAKLPGARLPPLMQCMAPPCALCLWVGIAYLILAVPIPKLQKPVGIVVLV